MSGPPHDLHAGVDGGVGNEPLMDLMAVTSQLLNADDGSIAIPGFYRNVRPLLPKEVQLYEVWDGMGWECLRVFFCRACMQRVGDGGGGVHWGFGGQKTPWCPSNLLHLPDHNRSPPQTAHACSLFLALHPCM